MFVPLLVLDGLLLAALALLLVRQGRLRARARAVPQTMRSTEARAERAIASVRRSEGAADLGEEAGTGEARPDVPADRRPRRRVRRVGPPATPDRP